MSYLWSCPNSSGWPRCSTNSTNSANSGWQAEGSRQRLGAARKRCVQLEAELQTVSLRRVLAISPVGRSLDGAELVRAKHTFDEREQLTDVVGALLALACKEPGRTAGE